MKVWSTCVPDRPRGPTLSDDFARFRLGLFRPTDPPGGRTFGLFGSEHPERPTLFWPQDGVGSSYCHIENWAFSSDFDRPTDRLTDRPTLSGAKEGRSKEGRKFRPTDSPVLGPTLGRIPYFQLSTPCTYYTHSSLSNCRFEASPFFRHRQSSRRTVAVPLPAAANNLATHCMRCVERRCHQFARAVAWYVQGA